MGRPKRADEAGGIYHMLNQANRREPFSTKTLTTRPLRMSCSKRSIGSIYDFTVTVSCPITGIW